MILQLHPGLPPDQIAALAQHYGAISLNDSQADLLVTPSKVKAPDPSHASQIAAHWDTGSDIQLASRKYRPETRRIALPNGVVVGGSTQNTVMITGPCSVESEAQIRQSAELCVGLGIKIMRAGAYKPRTSPYTFQGLGLEGLKLLAKMRDEYCLGIITEVRDATHVDEVIEYSDIVQIGAKSMYDHGILRACAKMRKPVLLKRGFGTTLQEFVQAAEFILSGGNPNVMLCERGIRTFETKTRFTLDLCGAAWLKANTNLPVFLDPSHAMGYRYAVADLTRACLAFGCDGLLIETHPTPASALSDADQQLDHPMFTQLYRSLGPIAAAVGRVLV